MAEFKTSGLTDLGLTLKQIAELPDEVIIEMLQAECNVEIEAQKRSLLRNGHKDTGTLINSIGSVRKDDHDGQIAFYVYPQGKRTIKGKDGKSRKVRNAEIGFVLEFGSSKIDGSEWMRSANEGSADEIVEAALEVYDKYLNSKNL